MSDCDCHQASEKLQRRTLAILVTVNAGMFAIESITGLLAQSTALLADSLDMFADATVYGLSLYAIGRGDGSKTRAALWSGVCQITLAGLILTDVIRRAWVGSEPVSALMVGIGLVALLANLYCLRAIAEHRQTEVHLRASWIFSRNDVIANLGTIASGFLVSLFDSPLPDLAIGLAIAALVLRGGIEIVQYARCRTVN